MIGILIIIGVIIAVAVIAVLVVRKMINDSGKSIEERIAGLLKTSHFDEACKDFRKVVQDTGEATSTLKTLIPLLSVDEKKVAKDLVKAAEENNVELFKSYRQIRAWDNPDMIVTDRDDTLALIAVEHESEDVLLLLIEMGADLDIENSEGVSAKSLIVKNLFEAAEENNLEKLKHYRQVGILDDINVQNNDGKTFGHIAVAKRFEELFSWLKAEGSKFDIPDNEGKTVESLLTEDPEVRMLKTMNSGTAEAEAAENAEK